MMDFIRRKRMYGDLIDMKERFEVNAKEVPYGFICSEETRDFLFEHCKAISGMSFQELDILHGLKIEAIKHWPDNMIWMLNKEDFEDFGEDGWIWLPSLMEQIIGRNA